MRLFSFDISQVPMSEHASQLSVNYLAGCHRAPVEPSFRSHRAEAHPSFRSSRDDCFNHIVWALTLFLDPGSLVRLRLDRELEVKSFANAVVTQLQPLLGWRAKWERGHLY